MKITEKYLQRVIKEEVKNVLQEQEQLHPRIGSWVHKKHTGKLTRYDMMEELKKCYREYHDGHWHRIAKENNYSDGWSEAYLYCLKQLKILQENAWRTRKFSAVHEAAGMKRQRFVDPTGGEWYQSPDSSPLGPLVPPAPSRMVVVKSEETGRDVGKMKDAEPGNGQELGRRGDPGKVIEQMIQSQAVCRGQRRESNEWPCREGKEIEKRALRIVQLRKICNYIIDIIEGSRSALKKSLTPR